MRKRVKSVFELLPFAERNELYAEMTKVAEKRSAYEAKNIIQRGVDQCLLAILAQQAADKRHRNLKDSAVIPAQMAKDRRRKKSLHSLIAVKDQPNGEGCYELDPCSEHFVLYSDNDKECGVGDAEFEAKINDFSRYIFDGSLARFYEEIWDGYMDRKGNIFLEFFDDGYPVNYVIPDIRDKIIVDPSGTTYWAFFDLQNTQYRWAVLKPVDTEFADKIRY